MGLGLFDLPKLGSAFLSWGDISGMCWLGLSWNGICMAELCWFGLAGLSWARLGLDRLILDGRSSARLSWCWLGLTRVQNTLEVICSRSVADMPKGWYRLSIANCLSNNNSLIVHCVHFILLVRQLIMVNKDINIFFLNQVKLMCFGINQIQTIVQIF